MRMMISNGALKNHDKKESTYIGLNTCMRILTNYKGSLTMKEENERFRVSIVLPLEQ